VVLAGVLLVNALIFAAPTFVGQPLQLWEMLVVAVMAGLAAVFGFVGLKGLRGAG
jgi:hypothetical protein